MNKDRQLFMVTYSQENKPFEYLGSDGLPISQSYNLYLKKCAEFKAKGKKYAQDNMYLKNSILPHIKCGYRSSEEFEEDVLCEREEQNTEYLITFDVSLFDEDQNSMYECFTGQSKRIRIIREINRDRNEEFSEDFEKKKMSWFTRYCTLSRFIQAARMIIIQNRLKKNLSILKMFTPKMIRKLEHEMAREQGEIVESSDEESKESLQSTMVSEINPCCCLQKAI